MAKRLFQTQGITFNAVAVGSAITNGVFYMALKGASNQLIDVLEAKVTGMASASTLGAFQLKRASALETGGASALASPNSDGFEFPNASALSSSATSFIQAVTTQPTPSNTTTDATLDLGINGFGGIFRWNAAPGQEWKIIGNAATSGESVLFNSSSGSGVNCAANIHILYEPY